MSNINQIERLVKFSEGIIEGGKRKDYIEEYQKNIDKLTPYEVISVIDQLIKAGYSVETVKKNVGKILNIFYNTLKKFKKPNPEKDSFLYFLEQENKEAEKLLYEIKQILKAVNKKTKDIEAEKEVFKQYFVKFKEFEKHYSKKENILFPFLEKHWNNYGCLSVMWAFHDDIRTYTNKCIDIFSQAQISLKEVNMLIGKFFFAVLPIIFREQYILHPVVIDTIDNKIIEQMMVQSFEIGFAFIPTPLHLQTKNNNTIVTKDYKELGKIFVDLKTGILEQEQVIMLLNSLPVDITYVDETDTVVYFSNPKHRFFTRSKAIIGRKVQNCHPHDSVHIVNKIIESFRTGKKDKARFWIQIKGRFALIEYYAVRDKNNNYKGTLEVSQDITEIRKLTGERRLLEISG